MPETPSSVLPEAVFITGVSRSGTTLLRSVLERSSVIAIAFENHYLGHLLERWGVRHAFRGLGDARDDATVRKMVDLLYSGELQRRSWFREISTFWRWVIKNVERDEVERRLLASDRTDRGIFAAFLRLYADRTGKQVMGEKTPAHINYADTLIEWYPSARIIQMVRDPRGVYISELRRRRGKAVSVPYRQLVHVPPLFSLFILLQITWAWARAIDRHRELVLRTDNYRMVHFEDLVRAPESTLRDLFDFLGVEMEPKVLEQKVVSRGVNAGAEGFDASAADRWRDSISWVARRWLELALGGRMREMGYRD